METVASADDDQAEGVTQPTQVMPTLDDLPIRCLCGSETEVDSATEGDENDGLVCDGPSCTHVFRAGNAIHHCPSGDCGKALCHQCVVVGQGEAFHVGSPPQTDGAREETSSAQQHQGEVELAEAEVSARSAATARAGSAGGAAASRSDGTSPEDDRMDVLSQEEVQAESVATPVEVNASVRGERAGSVPGENGVLGDVAEGKGADDAVANVCPVTGLASAETCWCGAGVSRHTVEEGDAHFDGEAWSCWSCNAPLNQGQAIGVCIAASAAQGGKCFPPKRWCLDCLEGPFTSRPEADEEEEPEQSDTEWTAGLEWYKCRCDGELAKIDGDTLEEGEAIYCALCDCDVGDQAVYGCLNDCQGPVCQQCATDPDRFRVCAKCELNGDSFVTMRRGVTFVCSECGAL